MAEIKTDSGTGSHEQRRAFVTGATGAVGTALVRQLQKQGWGVSALHRESSDITILRALDVDLVEGDICRADSIAGKVPPGTHVFFHVAADMNQWSRHNARQLKINVGGTRNAVEAALGAGVGRFIHTSTISAYGRHNKPINEDSPTHADHSFICYERSKWLAEQEVRKGIERGLDAVIVNPCAIMGPGFTAGWAMLFHQIKAGKMKALPPGTLVANHIDEVVKALVAASEKGRTGHNYILTGDAVPVATLIRKAGEIMGIDVTAKIMDARLIGLISRLSDILSKITGREPDLTPEMAALMSQKLSCDTDKARRELGYNEVPWVVGLDEMYHWLHARGEI